MKSNILQRSRKCLSHEGEHTIRPYWYVGALYTTFFFLSGIYLVLLFFVIFFDQHILFAKEKNPSFSSKTPPVQITTKGIEAFRLKIKTLRQQDKIKKNFHTKKQLKSLGKNLIPVIIMLLQHYDNRKNHLWGNSDAVWAIGILGDQASHTIPVLIKIYNKSHSKWFKYQIIDALGKMKRNYKILLPFFIMVAQSSNSWTRVKAIEILSQMKHIALPAIPLLLQHLQSKSVHTKNASIKALVSIALGNRNYEHIIVAHLKKMKNNERSWVRFTIRSALNHLQASKKTSPSRIR